MKKVLLLSFMALLALPTFAQAHDEGRPDKEAFRSAFKECKEQAGDTAKLSERPSKEVRQKVKECMKAKGFKKPKGDKHREHREHRLEQKEMAPAAE